MESNASALVPKLKRCTPKKYKAEALYSKKNTKLKRCTPKKYKAEALYSKNALSSHQVFIATI
ncbi:MAG: hypothetical protein KAI83_06555 [Thiomargarita sp.]|nr:hypothetical protein [Thiomargarita sp.]